MQVISFYQWLSRRQTEKNQSSSCDCQISSKLKRISELEKEYSHALAAISYHLAHISALQDAVIRKNEEIDNLKAQLKGDRQ